jgi:hypothetical protein
MEPPVSLWMASRDAFKLLVDLAWELNHDTGSVRCVLSPPLAARLSTAHEDGHDIYGMISRPARIEEYRRAYAVLEVLTEAEIEARESDNHPASPGDPYSEDECAVCADHHGGGYNTLVDGVCFVCTYEQDGWSADDDRMSADLQRAMESD